MSQVQRTIYLHKKRDFLEWYHQIIYSELWFLLFVNVPSALRRSIGGKTAGKERVDQAGTDQHSDWGTAYLYLCLALDKAQRSRREVNKDVIWYSLRKARYVKMAGDHLLRSVLHQTSYVFGHVRLHRPRSRRRRYSHCRLLVAYAVDGLFDHCVPT